MVSLEVDDSFKSIMEITESIEINNKDFKTDKRTIGTKKHKHKWQFTNKISRENESCDSSLASIQEKTKEKQWPKKLGNNQPKATARKDDTSEQTKKVIIVDDSIFNHVRGYYLSHPLENCQVHLKNLPSARVKCMQDYVKPSFRKHPHHLNNSF